MLGFILARLTGRKGHATRRAYPHWARRTSALCLPSHQARVSLPSSSYQWGCEWISARMGGGGFRRRFVAARRRPIVGATRPHQERLWTFSPRNLPALEGPTPTRWSLCSFPFASISRGTRRKEPSAKGSIFLGDRECYAAEAIAGAAHVMGMRIRCFEAALLVDMRDERPAGFCDRANSPLWQPSLWRRRHLGAAKGSTKHYSYTGGGAAVPTGGGAPRFPQTHRRQAVSPLCGGTPSRAISICRVLPCFFSIGGRRSPTVGRGKMGPPS